MAMRSWLVLIDWIDDDVEDSDEIRVSADCAREAISKARAKWRMTIGAQWPHCRIVSSIILTPERIRGFA